MRVLFITETVPFPLDSGGRIKTFNTLRMLAGRHDVRLHAFIRDEAQRAHRAALEGLGVPTTLHLVPRSTAREAWYAVRSLAGAPYTVGRHFDAAVFGALRDEVATWRPDLVYCDHLSMAEYATRLDAPIAYDAHNVEFAILQRFAATRSDPVTRTAAAVEWRRVRRYEAEVCRRSRLVFVVSDVDRRVLAELSGGRGPFVEVPIAVDAVGATPIATLTTAPRLLFLGGLHWPPNADALASFVRDGWPRVRAARPDATLTSVGRDDSPLVDECRRAPGVRLAGWVPDIDPFVQESRALVVPMRAGSGMRVKILDAMARGLPVVTTSVGCEGIQAVSGEHLWVADHPDAFADAVVRVLADDALAASLARNARALVLARYDVSAVRSAVLSALDGVGCGSGSGQTGVREVPGF
ncbi:MAG: glycosyltransferase [Vicinamibacterales bacterium]